MCDKDKKVLQTTTYVSHPLLLGIVILKTNAESYPYQE